MSPISTGPGALWGAAVQALKRGDRTAARAACQRLLSAIPGHRGALELLARLAMESGDLPGCETWLREALAAAPEDANLLMNMAVVRRQQGDSAGAAEFLERAASLSPPHGPAVAQLALQLKQAGRDDEAVARLEPVIDAGGVPASVVALQAQLLERLNRPDEARTHAEAALALDPSEPTAHLLLAELDLRAGRSVDALNRIDRLPEAATRSPANAALAQYLASRARDSLGQSEAAFASAAAANRILAREYFRQHKGDEGAYAPPAVDTIGRWLRALPDSGQAPADAPCNPAPVFLMGFPRSGTTLVEQILRRHPGIAAIEEKDLLAPLIAPYLGDPADLDVLVDPAGRPRREARRRYVANALVAADAEPGELVIDKLPLNSVFLPVIGKLFPEARILLALRDPRDVCLSCFLQSFGLNAAMAQFLDLGTTAAYYEAVMGNVLEAMTRLPMQIQPVRYEAVVEDLETEARRLLEFLDLPWDPDVLAYRDGLVNRVVNTPSRSQVSQPLYRSAVGRWRRYARHLAPVRDRLDALAGRLEYPAGPQERKPPGGAGR